MNMPHELILPSCQHECFCFCCKRIEAETTEQKNLFHDLIAVCHVCQIVCHKKRFLHSMCAGIVLVSAHLFDKICVSFVCLLCVKKSGRKGKKGIKNDTHQRKRLCKSTIYKAFQCPRLDSNQHAVSSATTSKQCVYQFRHPGSLV